MSLRLRKCYLHILEESGAGQTGQATNLSTQSSQLLLNVKSSEKYHVFEGQPSIPPLSSGFGDFVSQALAWGALQDWEAWGRKYSQCVFILDSGADTSPLWVGSFLGFL